MTSQREFAIMVAAWFTFFICLLSIGWGFYISKNIECNSYKAKYRSALDYIKQEFPAEQENELMAAITALIEQNAKELK